MGLSASVAVFPLGGPFHTRWPRYNAVHVRESLRAFAPHVVALAPLPPGALSDPGWQDTDELALPHTVVPWARAAGVPVVEVGLAEGDPDDPGLPNAADQLRRYLEMYDEGRERLRQVDAAWEPVRELLARPLDMGAVVGELLPAVERLQALERELLGEGPGDGWRDARAAVVARRALAAAVAMAEHERLGSGGAGGGSNVRLAVMAGLESVPALRRAFSAPAAAATGVTVEMVEPAQADAGDEARDRALMDAALAGTGEPESLLRGLAALSAPEARFLEADLLLGLGHLEEATHRLQQLVLGDFHEPYYLPGFALARLGQLHDLAGRRDDALRCYRGVLALSYAPAAARAAAAEGLSSPFALPAAPPSPRD
jgi:tetratricopeptide (TPR) repeat protein